MRYILVVVLLLGMVSIAQAKDVVIKGVPEEISDQQLTEWCSVLIERYENAKLNQIQAVSEAVKTTQTNIDVFRKANSLDAKYEVKEEKEIVTE